MFIVLCCYYFSDEFNSYFLSTSQEIGWEERPRYDLFSVKWDVKPNSINRWLV